MIIVPDTTQLEGLPTEVPAVRMSCGKDALRTHYGADSRVTPALSADRSELVGSYGQKRRAEGRQFTKNRIDPRHQPRQPSAARIVDRSRDALDPKPRRLHDASQFGSRPEMRRFPERREAQPAAQSARQGPCTPPAKITQHQPPAGSEHPRDFAEGKHGLRDECKHRDDGDEIETPIVKGQPLDVGQEILDRRTLPGRLGGCVCNHPRVNVTTGDEGRTPGRKC